MVKAALKDAGDRMQSAVRVLTETLTTIRTGRASPSLVENLLVDYFGQPTPLNQLASISVPEARMLLVRPFDVSTLKDIERAILGSDLGLTPNSDGKTIRLMLPALTEERRRDLTKIVGTRVEEARVAVRNVRRDVHNLIRDKERETDISKDEAERAQKDLQAITDRNVEEIAKIGQHKQDELMHV